MARTACWRNAAPSGSGFNLDLSKMVGGGSTSGLNGGKAATFASTFCLNLEGDAFALKEVSCSLDPSSTNYITRALGKNADNSRSGSNS